MIAVLDVAVRVVLVIVAGVLMALAPSPAAMVGALIVLYLSIWILVKEIESWLHIHQNRD